MPASRIIPTPQCIEVLPGPAKAFVRAKACRILVLGEDERSRFAASALRSHLTERSLRCRCSYRPGTDTDGLARADFVLCGARNKAVAGLLPERPAARLAGAESEQGYRLWTSSDGPTILYSSSSIGLLYAMATLLQLFEPVDDGIRLPNVAIEDRPDFRFRGNNWCMFGEIGGWSYDQGDGLVAYEQRFVRKLDLCWRYKINLLICDGLGWNADRFAGYSRMMRRLNRAARLRGVRLLYTGYGSGYGAASNDSKAFMNRTRYPHGATYPCCGTPGNPNTEKSRLMGTCLSNLDLLALKQQQIAEFARRIQPGALYIHNLDVSRSESSAQCWKMRCPRCRERWPNDDIAAPDGMAGAFAWFYDALADAINEVKDPRTDYAASRDCLLLMVSPNYSNLNEADSTWQEHCRYFGVMAEHLRNPNIAIGLREQYCNHEVSAFRYGQLREAIRARGREQAFGTICFSGGAGYYNSLPVIAPAVLNGCFAGADFILHANGNGYQEPQQLINAEFCWNSRGSSFHDETLPASYEEFRPRYVELASGKTQPPGIFGPEGLLEHACRKLYGAEAGRLLAEIYRLRGTCSLESLSEFLDRPCVLLPAWNILMPVGAFSIFRRKRIKWQMELPDVARESLEVLYGAYEQIADLNRRAACVAAKALSLLDSPDSRADIAWLQDSLAIGAELAQCMHMFAGIFLRAHASVIGTRPYCCAAEDMATLCTLLDQLAGRDGVIASATVIDHLGADPGYRQQVIRWLREQMRHIEHTLRTGEWLEQAEVRWW